MYTSISWMVFLDNPSRDQSFTIFTSKFGFGGGGASSSSISRSELPSLELEDTLETFPSSSTVDSSNVLPTIEKDGIELSSLESSGSKMQPGSAAGRAAAW